MINQILRRFFRVMFLVVLLPGMALAQRDWVFVGPRAVGMGSAYLAVANNAEAVYWNPAALARMEHFHFTFGYGDFYKVNFKSYYASTVFNFPLGRRVGDYFTFGLDWLGLQDSSQPRADIKNQFHAALGIKPFKSVPTLSFGVSTNLRHQDDWNVGALYSLPFVPFKSSGRFSLGIMFHNRYGTPETRPIDHKNILKDHRFRYGLSYQLFKGLGPIMNPLLAIDYGERLHQGMELTVKLMDRLNAMIRYGMQKDLKNREKMTHSFGITLTYDFRGPLTKGLLTAMPQVEVAEVAGETGQPEVCFHFARTNSPEWNSCYQYGVAAVIQSTAIPVPAPEPATICPSQIILNWKGSPDNYEDGYIILRNKVNPNADYWFLKGLGWREHSYSDVCLYPDAYTYRFYAYKENIDPPLVISHECQTSHTTARVEWLCNLTITNGTKSINLTFGTEQTATDGLDAPLCEQQLAGAQAEEFDARFVLSVNNIESVTDIRPTASLPWIIKLQPGKSKKQFVLSWNPSTLPPKTIGIVELKIFSDVNPRRIVMQDTTKTIIDRDEDVSQLEIIFTKVENKKN